MLPKKERLSRQAFSRFFSVGRKIHTPLFQVVYSPHPTLHVSVVVSKKISKRAVGRNKIRRRVYDAVRRYRTESGLTGVYIFIMKTGVEVVTYENLKKEIYTTITKILST